MDGWYWFLVLGGGVAVIFRLLFPAPRLMGIAQLILVSCTGALIGGMIFVKASGYPCTHWLTLLTSGLTATLFFWLVRLFSPRRIL